MPSMERRTFLGTIAGGLLAAPLAAEAQQAGKVWRIGFLGVADPTRYARGVEAVRLGLRDHGYVEGRNITIEFRWAEGRYDRLPELAAELVHLKVDVIITHGTPGTLATTGKPAWTHFWKPPWRFSCSTRWARRASASCCGPRSC
jgi:putative ABC transport system substrate-binding protein